MNANWIKDQHEKIKKIKVKRFTRPITNYNRYEVRAGKQTWALASHRITCYEKGCDDLTEKEYELWELEPPYYFHLMCKNCTLKKERQKRIKIVVHIMSIIFVVIIIISFMIIKFGKMSMNK